MQTVAQSPTATQQAKAPESSNQSRGLLERSRDLHPLIYAESKVGNSTIQPDSPRSLGAAKVQGKGRSTSSPPRIQHHFSQILSHPKSPLSIQPKMAISSPEEIHEREANRVADQIIRMPEPNIRRKCSCGGEGCPKCRDEETDTDNQIMRSKGREADAAITANTTLGATGAPPIVNDVLRSPGKPLDPSTRSFFEPRFGHDFGQVRIHTGAHAAESAKAINAKAYTFGGNIVFGKGEYRPESTAGKSLLAHELVHVRQQSGAEQTRIDRFAECGPIESCPPRDSGEERASQTDPMSVHGITNPDGILVANFAVGSSTIKPDLATNPTFVRIQSEMRANPDFRWDIVGFSDCEGGEATNTSLRDRRAVALGLALSPDLRRQITGIRGAPINECIQGNATAGERTFNRSAFLQQTVTEYTFPEESVETAPPAGRDLYGVTSPASQYFVRASPDGEIIGRLILREMRVRVVGESGTNIENLWLQVRFSASDMAAVQAAYQHDMAARTGGLAGLQRRRTELQDYIAVMESRPGMDFEVRPQITRAREELAPIENEIRQIEAYQRRLTTPYTGLTAWVGASALGVVAVHYDTFLNLVDGFDTAHASEPLRDRLTRLRQFGEDASLEGDAVIGRGGNLPNRVTQSTRTNNPSNWQLLFEAKQIRMPDGTFLDVHHFILGLDALALPASAQSSSRVLRSYLIASVNVGESWSAVTWSGDVGGAVGDYVLHKSGSWEAANTRDDNGARRRFYFDTRAPESDLLADIDSWGAFGDIPRTNTAPTTFTSLRQIFEATYGPAGQTARQYTAQITPRRRQGVENFLCNYGFTSPAGLVSQTAARARVLDQVRIFATSWYDARASSTGVNTVVGRTGGTDAQILTASGQMTDIFLNWLQGVASTVGLTSMTCDRLSSPLRRAGE